MKRWAKRLEREWKNVIFNVLFAVLNLVVVSFFYKNVFVVSIVLGVLAFAFILYYRSKVLVPVFIFSMVGALAEMFAITYGVWSYAAPNFVNIPGWLFILWGNAGLFIYRTAVEFERLGFHR